MNDRLDRLVPSFRPLRAAHGEAASAFALHVWDVAAWTDDLYQAEVAAAAARQAKLKSVYRRATVMGLLGAAKRTGEEAPPAQGAPVPPMALPQLAEASRVSSVRVDEEDDMDTPRLLNQFMTALRPVIMEGHRSVRIGR